MSMTGQVLHTYKNKNLSGPYGLDVSDDGSILVCGYWSNNVQVISEDGETFHELQNKDNEIDWPTSMCINGQHELVYLGCRGSPINKFLVYKLH